ncbi:MAG: hypothetical protein IJV00_06995, partial [Clostridia bacterium]|nr:hypothetical protein [Clostridia bacterium]
EELFNAFRGLVLYPEKKDLTAGPAFNSSSDRFFSDGCITPDGFEVSCFVPFKGRKNKGDLIGIHVEARFNKAPGEKVQPKFTLARGHLNEAYRATPSGLCWFVLG